MNSKYKLGFLVGAVVAALSGGAWYLHAHNIASFSPQGPLAAKERSLIVFGLLLSLVIVIPVFVLLLTFAWKYRETNTKAKYTPEADHSRLAEITWWVVPSILILILSIVTWRSSYALDPFKPLAQTTAKPLTIQVVAMDWKWLFIYPEQGIASVNYVQFPVSTPVNFQITSDAPMNSFWIPQLSGQIYAMPGMSTQLHVMADHTGTFRGSSANISGAGFAGMVFSAHASSPAGFDQWVGLVRQSPKQLTLGAYNQLAKPSTDNPVAYFSSSEPSLYDDVVMKYMMPGMEGSLQ